MELFQFGAVSADVRCGPLRTAHGSLGSGRSQRELAGSRVMGGDSETKGGDGGENLEPDIQAQKNLIQNPGTSPKSV